MSMKELMFEEKITDLLERICGKQRKKYDDSTIKHNEYVMNELKKVRKEMETVETEEELVELLSKETKLEKSLIWRENITKEVNGVEKIVRQRILFKDSLTGFDKLNIKYLNKAYRLMRMVRKGVIEVIADIHLTENKELNRVRIATVVEAILGKKINKVTMRKMLIKGAEINGEMYKMKEIQLRGGDYLKGVIEKFELKKEYDENRRLEHLYSLNTGTTRDTRGDYTIFKLGVKLFWKLDEFGRRIVEENELGVEEISRDFSEVRIGDEWLTQGEFDMEYKMFSERANREDEVNRDFNFEEMLDDILDEIDFY